MQNTNQNEREKMETEVQNNSIEESKPSTLQERARTNGRKPRRTETEIETIKNKIRAAMLANTSHQTILKQLEIPQATFYRYLDQIHEETLEQKLKKQTRLLGEYYSQIEDICQELYKKYKKTKDAKYLVERAKLINDSFDRLQSAGFLPKAKDQLEVDASEEVKIWLAGIWKRAEETEKNGQSNNSKV